MRGIADLESLSVRLSFLIRKTPPWPHTYQGICCAQVTPIHIGGRVQVTSPCMEGHRRTRIAVSRNRDPGIGAFPLTAT